MSESIADRAVRTLEQHWPASHAAVAAIIYDVESMTQLETMIVIADGLVAGGQRQAAQLVLELAAQKRAVIDDAIAKMKSRQEPE